MKILIDTNIILDLALMRHPFYDQADQISARPQPHARKTHPRN